MLKNINITAQADGQTVALELPDIKLQLNATDIENFITALAAARRALKPEPLAQPIPNQQVQATANPSFVVQTDEVMGGVNVGLRDLGIGWIWFHFGVEQGQTIVEAMTKHNAVSLVATSRTIN
jgi:hypothetical protein